jgi:hypothetical protein
MRQSRARNGVGEVVFPTELTGEYDGFKWVRWSQRGAGRLLGTNPTAQINVYRIRAVAGIGSACGLE